VLYAHAYTRTYGASTSFIADVTHAIKLCTYVHVYVHAGHYKRSPAGCSCLPATCSCSISAVLSYTEQAVQSLIRQKDREIDTKSSNCGTVAMLISGQALIFVGIILLAINSLSVESRLVGANDAFLGVGMFVIIIICLD
jgi:hypothetical protein